MRLFEILGRYLLVWFINVVALLVATSILPGFHFDTSDPNWYWFAILLPVEFALLLILLRPLMLVLTFPLNSLTLGLPTLLFNGVILYITADQFNSVVIDSVLHAVVGLVVLTIVSTSLVGWARVDDTYPFFQSVIFRLRQRFGSPRPVEDRRGLLLLQVDGLSLPSLLRAMERGRMTMVSYLTTRGSHQLYRWCSGLPSNTPAVQAGLFYGARADVPGYRWYDRSARIQRVASKPADLRLLEQQALVAGDEPLLTGGSSIISFMSGGAAKRLVTVSAQGGEKSEQRQEELEDVNLFWASPFAYTRALVSAFWDFNVALFWGAVNRVLGRRPRLRFSWRRLGARVVANAFLREIGMFWLRHDIMRGVPIIYSNFVGYDEVAHYSGPDTYEAQVTLANFNRKFHRLWRLLRHYAPIKYDVVLLSDHGQTPSIPFRIRHGRSLRALVVELAGQSLPGIEVPPLETMYVSALLEDFRQSGAGQAGWVAARSRRTLEQLSGQQITRTGDDVRSDEPPILVLVSGCLAHIYLGESERQLTLEQIRDRYPGMVEGLASHPGIGFVAARRENGVAMAIGKDGVRDLDTGQVKGKFDPLAPYEEPEHWSRELHQLLAFQSAGDLVVNGKLLPDGRVVVFEEQLSSHGGLGGAQTEPFLLAPRKWGFAEADLVSPEALHAKLLGIIRQKRSTGGEKSGTTPGTTSGKVTGPTK
ncbi:MAG: phage holin family protein [bacterium]